MCSFSSRFSLITALSRGPARSIWPRMLCTLRSPASVMSRSSPGQRRVAAERKPTCRSYFRDVRDGRFHGTSPNAAWGPVALPRVGRYASKLAHSGRIVRFCTKPLSGIAIHLAIRRASGENPSILIEGMCRLCWFTWLSRAKTSRPGHYSILRAWENGASDLALTHRVCSARQLRHRCLRTQRGIHTMMKLGFTVFAAAVLALPLCAEEATFRLDDPFDFSFRNTTAPAGKLLPLRI